LKEISASTFHEKLAHAARACVSCDVHALVGPAHWLAGFFGLVENETRRRALVKSREMWPNLSIVVGTSSTHVPSIPVADVVLARPGIAFVAGYETAAGVLLALQTTADGSRFAFLPGVEASVGFVPDGGSPAKLDDVRADLDYEICIAATGAPEGTGRWVRFVETTPPTFVIRPPPRATSVLSSDASELGIKPALPSGMRFPVPAPGGAPGT
jgi:hypothetical protein